MNSVNISVVMASYNRAHTLPRAINSVLAQSFENWELIIVDDGSTDDTIQVLENYKDDRIKLVRHEINKGVCAAKNTGLNAISGRWFTTLDSDDEMLPQALSVLFRITEEFGEQLDAVSCNCIDTSTGKFSGKGLSNDQWLSFEDVVQKCSGEFWGITKTDLLGNNRFNEEISGGEDILWYKIGKNAKRYYVHSALRIYHTEGDDRVSKGVGKFNLKKRFDFYRGIANEEEYLQTLSKFNPSLYGKIIFNILVVRLVEGNRYSAVSFLKNKIHFLSFEKFITILFMILVGSKFSKIIINLFVKFK